MSAVRLLTALVVATAILVGYRAEVPEDVMDPRLAVNAAREGVRQADEDLDRVRDFWLG